MTDRFRHSRLKKGVVAGVLVATGVGVGAALANDGDGPGADSGTSG